MSTCPICGSRIRDWAPSCPSCGVALEWEDEGDYYDDYEGDEYYSPQRGLLQSLQNIQSTWLVIGGSIAALFACTCACCFGLGIAEILLSEDESVTKVARPSIVSPLPTTPEKIHTQQVTPTPKPTATPVPPTNTPEPATGMPLEAELYLETVIKEGQNLAEALKGMSRLMQEPNITDNAWKTDVAIQMGIIRVVRERLEGLVPPPGLEEAHRILLEGTGACDEATHKVAEGIDNLDIGVLSEAGPLLTVCNTKIEEATGLMLEYMGQPQPTVPAPAGTIMPMPTPAPVPTPTPQPPTTNCDPSYPGVCIPPPPPDLNCKDIPHRNFTVLPPDPHDFDGNKDGVGCEE